MKVSRIGFTGICICSIAYVLLVFSIRSYPSNLEKAIYILSLLGWGVWFFIILSWKRVSNEWFCMYTIFMSFLMLFSFGQCLMWALGIHIPKEIGRYSSIPSTGISSYMSIYDMQILSLVSILFFHLGAILAYRDVVQEKRNDNDSTTELWQKRILHSIFNITFIVSSISTYIIWIGNMFINRTFGYGAYLYDTEAIAGRSNILTLLSWMFVPSIIGLLLCTDYSKWTMRVCYGCFTGYVIICTMAGYRSWIYELVILILLHNKAHRRMNIKNIALGGVLLFFVLVIATSLKNSRQTGISFQALGEAIYGAENPITAAFFEMGSSMHIGTIILSDPSFNYPYGNTYLLAIPGMITDRIVKLFIPGYESIGGWFSQSYLGLVGRGVGFSMIGESLVNYGIYGTPFWMLFLGIIMSKFIFSKKNDNSVISRFFSASTCVMLLPIARNTFLSTMKRWTFSTLSIVILFYIVISIKGRKKV